MRHFSHFPFPSSSFPPSFSKTPVSRFIALHISVYQDSKGVEWGFPQECLPPPGCSADPYFTSCHLADVSPLALYWPLTTPTICYLNFWKEQQQQQKKKPYQNTVSIRPLIAACSLALEQCKVVFLASTSLCLLIWIAVYLTEGLCLSY